MVDGHSSEARSELCLHRKITQPKAAGLVGYSPVSRAQASSVASRQCTHAAVMCVPSSGRENAIVVARGFEARKIQHHLVGPSERGRRRRTSAFKVRFGGPPRLSRWEVERFRVLRFLRKSIDGVGEYRCFFLHLGEDAPIVAERMAERHRCDDPVRWFQPQQLCSLFLAVAASFFHSDEPEAVRPGCRSR